MIHVIFFHNAQTVEKFQFQMFFDQQKTIYRNSINLNRLHDTLKCIEMFANSFFMYRFLRTLNELDKKNGSVNWKLECWQSDLKGALVIFETITKGIKNHFIIEYGQHIYLYRQLAWGQWIIYFVQSKEILDPASVPFIQKWKC